MTILTPTTGLADELTLNLRTDPANCFTISYLGLTNIGVHLEFAAQAIHQDLKVQLTHSGDNGLARLLISRDPERGILLSQTRQSHPHALLVRLGLGLYRLRNHRLRKLHALQHDMLVRITQSFTRSDITQTYDRSDITGDQLLELSAIIGMHLQNTSNTLPLLLDWVINSIPRPQHTGVDAHKSQITHKWICH